MSAVGLMNILMSMLRRDGGGWHTGSDSPLNGIAGSRPPPATSLVQVQLVVHFMKMHITR